MLLLCNMQSESDSDSNGAISSFGNGSEHAGHEEDQPGPGKEDGAASHLPIEASHSQQVFVSALKRITLFNNVSFCRSFMLCFPGFSHVATIIYASGCLCRTTVT